MNMNMTWSEAFGRLYGGAENKEPFSDLTIREICRMTPSELRKMRGIGGRTAGEIVERLNKEGLSLGMTDTAIDAVKPQLCGKYVELHEPNTGAPFLVNTHIISSVHPCGDGTTVCIVNGKEFNVRESYESVREVLGL